jgi:hypothetical protein
MKTIFNLCLLAFATVHAKEEKRRLGLPISVDQKAALRFVLTKGVDLMVTCAVPEFNSLGKGALTKLGFGGTVNAFGDKIRAFLNSEIQKIQRGRLWPSFSDIGNAANSVVSTARAGAAAVQEAAFAVDKAIGGQISGAGANVVWPALVNLLSGGIKTQTGINMPQCIKNWLTGECKKLVAAGFKKQRLLRRFGALRREIVNL